MKKDTVRRFRCRKVGFQNDVYQKKSETAGKVRIEQKIKNISLPRTVLRLKA